MCADQGGVIPEQSIYIFKPRENLKLFVERDGIKLIFDFEHEGMPVEGGLFLDQIKKLGKPDKRRTKRYNLLSKELSLGTARGSGEYPNKFYFLHLSIMVPESFLERMLIILSCEDAYEPDLFTAEYVADMDSAFLYGEEEVGVLVKKWREFDANTAYPLLITGLEEVQRQIKFLQIVIRDRE